MTTVGILCPRMRSEERAMMEALARAGASARLIDLEAMALELHAPLPPMDVLDSCDLLVDRLPHRSIMEATAAIWRSWPLPLWNAGLASEGNRLRVATQLAAAGLPQPDALVVTSEAAGADAIRRLNLPATGFSLGFDGGIVTIDDADVAEAIFEHRTTLGNGLRGPMLLQRGAPDASRRRTLLVIDQVAIAAAPSPRSLLPDGDARILAEAAAGALDAACIGIEVAIVDDQLCVWDVQPVPEFRSFVPFDQQPVAEIIATSILARIASRREATVIELAAFESAARPAEMRQDQHVVVAHR